MNLKLDGKVVFITASSKGIGQATAKTFLNEGATVIINGRNETELYNTTLKLQNQYGKSRVLSIVGDMSKENTIKAVFEKISLQFNSVDILVGVLGSGKPISKNKLDRIEWEHMLQINLLSSVQLLHIFTPLLKKGKGGSVIFLTSLAAYDRISAPPAYAAAKKGLTALIEYMAKELSNDNIRINGVSPGNIFYPGGRWDDLKRQDLTGVTNYIENEVPLKRFGTAEEIASSIAFLASDLSSFTTGTILKIDGGQSIGF